MERDAGSSHRIGDLLLYLPEYRVVVCRQCRYAIQPNALSSHLQKHKIFRHHRQDLLQQVARYDLAVPGDAPCPSSLHPAIPELPVLQGYKCLAGGCNYLCTSEKRLSQHWSQVHDCSDRNSIHARPAKMQTFFRGTCIRYFEVGPLTEDAALDSFAPADSSTHPSEAGHAPSQSPSSSVYNEPTDVIPRPGLIDMRALLYMHHFTISTAPTMSLGAGSATFWSHELPQLASRHEYLLFGLLGMGACHKAFLAARGRERDEHRMAAHDYQSAALFQYRNEVEHATPDNAVALGATARLLGIQDTVLSSFDVEDMQQHGEEVSVDVARAILMRFLIMLQGSSRMLMQFHQCFPTGCGLALSPAAYERLSSLNQSTGIDVIGMPILTSGEAFSQRIPVQVNAAVRSVPSKLANVQEITQDDLYLAVCCCGSLLQAIDMTYHCDEPALWTAWTASMGWATSCATQEALLPALNNGRPIAFVVVAVYGAFLSPRVAGSLWFTRGHSVRTLDLCRAGLSNHSELLQIVEGICAAATLE